MAAAWASLAAAAAGGWVGAAYGRMRAGVTRCGSRSPSCHRPATAARRRPSQICAILGAPLPQTILGTCLTHANDDRLAAHHCLIHANADRHAAHDCLTQASADRYAAHACLTHASADRHAAHAASHCSQPLIDRCATIYHICDM